MCLPFPIPSAATAETEIEITAWRQSYGYGTRPWEASHRTFHVNSVTRNVKKMNTTSSYSHWHVQDGADSSVRDVWVMTVMCTFLCADCVFEECMRAVRYTAVSSAPQCLLLVSSGYWSSLHQPVSVSRYFRAANTLNSKVNETCFAVGRKCYRITYRSCSYAVWKKRRKLRFFPCWKVSDDIFDYLFLSL